MGENIIKMKGNKEINQFRLISNMILLLGGRLVSSFGSRIYSFAIGVYILRVTGSGMLFSISLVTSTIPAIIFGPVSGIISDKFDRKKLVVLMDILSGVVVLGLFALAYVDSLKIIYIYVASFLLSTCSTFFSTPLTASIPDIVDEKNLTRINSLNQAMISISTIAGPFIGGLVYGIIDINLFLAINGISFIFSGISEMFIDFKLNKKENNLKDNTKDKGKFWDGFKYIRTQTGIYTLFKCAIFLNFLITFGLTVPFPYIILELLGLSDDKFGILQAMFPAGMLFGSILLSILPETKKFFRKLMFGTITINIGLLLMGLSITPKIMNLSNLQYFIYYIVIIFIMSISIVVINIPLEVMMQKTTPDHMRGRVFGVISSITMAITPLGMILSGLLLDTIPVYILPVTSGVSIIAITVIMARNKNLRAL